MSVINQAVAAVMDMVDALGLYANIYRGALGTGNGICCEIGPTTPEIVFLNKHRYIPVDLTINGKHEELDVLSEAMNKIHDELPAKTSYTSGNGWQIVDITTSSFPQVIAREDEGPWIMASSLTVKVATFTAQPEPAQAE